MARHRGEREYSPREKGVVAYYEMGIRGGRISIDEVMEVTGISERGAYRIMDDICRVTPTYKEGKYYVLYMDGSRY